MREVKLSFVPLSHHGSCHASGSDVSLRQGEEGRKTQVGGSAGDAGTVCSDGSGKQRKTSKSHSLAGERGQAGRRSPVAEGRGQVPVSSGCSPVRGESSMTPKKQEQKLFSLKPATLQAPGGTSGAKSAAVSTSANEYHPRVCAEYSLAQ